MTETGKAFVRKPPIPKERRMEDLVPINIKPSEGTNFVTRLTLDPVAADTHATRLNT